MTLAIWSLCSPSIRGVGLRYRAWYCAQPASSRSRPETGDDHVAELIQFHHDLFRKHFVTVPPQNWTQAEIRAARV